MKISKLSKLFEKHVLKLPRYYYYNISFSLVLVLLVINLENHQQIGTELNPTFYPKSYMNVVLIFLKSIANIWKLRQMRKKIT
jgi:hypothetical protein